LIKAGIFVAGLFTVSQFSFWGNYIPLVFPTHLRGTGESFAANIGGRVLGTAAAWLTLTFSAATPPDPVRIALVGAGVAGAYALVGAILTQWLPEPESGVSIDGSTDPVACAWSSREPGIGEGGGDEEDVRLVVRATPSRVNKSESPSDGAFAVPGGASLHDRARRAGGVVG
jgi:hypothetical protein